MITEGRIAVNRHHFLFSLNLFCQTFFTALTLVITPLKTIILKYFLFCIYFLQNFLLLTYLVRIKPFNQIYSCPSLIGIFLNCQLNQNRQLCLSRVSFPNKVGPKFINSNDECSYQLTLGIYNKCESFKVSYIQLKLKPFPNQYIMNGDYLVDVLQRRQHNLKPSYQFQRQKERKKRQKNKRSRDKNKDYQNNKEQDKSKEELVRRLIQQEQRENKTKHKIRMRVQIQKQMQAIEQNDTINQNFSLFAN